MVSVIIPTYNYAQYLAETLQSVVNQSYTNWECIVVDDGSVDNTEEVVREFINKDSRFSFFKQENKGVSHARNIGVKVSKGKYIQFLDGDDLIQPNKLASQVHFLESNPSVDIVYSDVRFFDDMDYSNLRNSLHGNKPDDWLPKFKANGKAIIEYFCRMNFLVINAPLLSKKCVEEAGFFDENMKALEDWDFWMKCALRNYSFSFHKDKDDLALVRVHASSLSKEKKGMKKGNFMFLQHIMFHKNLSISNQVIVMLKYVELFWDSWLSGFPAFSQSIRLSVFSLLMFPIYLFIKLLRRFKY